MQHDKRNHEAKFKENQFVVSSQTLTFALTKICSTGSTAFPSFATAINDELNILQLCRTMDMSKTNAGVLAPELFRFADVFCAGIVLLSSLVAVINRFMTV